MNSQDHQDLVHRPEFYQYPPRGILWDQLQKPGVIVSAVILLFATLYQLLHSLPLRARRYPGDLVWDLILAATPASVLFAVDEWLHPPVFPIPKTMLTAQPRTRAAKAEALQRILGKDSSGGIIKSVACAGRRSLSTLSSSPLAKRDTARPPGLGNYDNSCFQNSILQGLASLRMFPEYLSKTLDDKSKEVDQGSATSLRDLISQLTDASNNGETLWTPVRLKSLDTWQQQDAQEYFSKLLDEIDKEIAIATKMRHKPQGLEALATLDDSDLSQHSDDSGYQSLSVLSKGGPDLKVPRNPLEGLVAQRVACVQCGFSEGLSMTPFNCVTLNLGVGQREHDLFELFDDYTHLESIEGVECAKCTLLKLQRLLNILIARDRDAGASDELIREPLARLAAVELALQEDDFEEKTMVDRCKVSAQRRVSSTKTKQAVIARPPPSLAVHMNRSVFDERTGYMYKNLAAVKYPKTLDLGPWCLGSADQPPSDSDAGTREEQPTDLVGDNHEQWSFAPRSSMVSGDLYPSKVSGPIYELRAVVTHQGQHENGHYICYRQHCSRPSKSEDIFEEKEMATSDRAETAKTEEQTENNERTVTDSDGSSASDSEQAAQWWRFSDENVWEVPEDVVLAQDGVFMLFYDCVDPNPVPASGSERTRQQDEALLSTLQRLGVAQGLALTDGGPPSREILDPGRDIYDTGDREEIPEEADAVPGSNEDEEVHIGSQTMSPVEAQHAEAGSTSPAENEVGEDTEEFETDKRRQGATSDEEPAGPAMAAERDKLNDATNPERFIANHQQSRPSDSGTAEPVA